MDNPSSAGHLVAELTAPSSASRAVQRLKWGDITLKRGVADLPAWSLLTLRPGQMFSLEVPQSTTGPTLLAELSSAVANHRVLDLTVSERSAVAVGRCNKIEALAIKQKVTESGSVVEIQLRKL